MAMQENPSEIPLVAQDYIDSVVKKMRYRKKVRAEVRAELEAHFEDALADCHDPKERQNLAEELIAGFGDIHILAKLIRRAKKRCRPLWAKVLVRTAQVAGLFVLYTLLCISRLYIGSSTIKVDTIARLNEQLQAGHDESTNAFPEIHDIVLSMDPFPDLIANNPVYRDMNDAERQCFDDYLLQNGLALDQLAVAVKKPYYWRQYDPVPLTGGDTTAGIIMGAGLLENIEMNAHLMDQLLSELPDYRSLSFTLNYRAQRYCTQGRADKALADALTLIQLGRRVTQADEMVEQFLGIAACSMGTQTMLDVLSDIQVSESLLGRTYETLADSYDWDQSWMDFTMERAIVDDMIQRSFTDDGHDNGRPLVGAMFFLGDSPANWLKGLLLLDYPDRKQVVEHIDSFFQDLNRWQTTTPWDRQNEPYRLSNTEISTTYTSMTKPALERTGEQAWVLKIDYQAILTVLAIKRYQVRHDQVPRALEALVTDGLMKELPRDFYAPGPLTYVRTSDTEFILYSWGQNLKDDGGTPSTDQNGDPKRYGPNGDWIFWPREP